MTETAVTVTDVIDAATDVLDGITSGSLRPADVERRAVAAVRELVGQVNGSDDVLWELHLSICRAVLEAGGLPSAELEEWVAVQKRREADNEG